MDTDLMRMPKAGGAARPSPTTAGRAIGLRPTRIRAIGSTREPNPGNRTWRVSTPDGTLMIRRSAVSRTPTQVDYELQVLRHLRRLGWPVPEPVGSTVLQGRIWVAFSLLRGRRAQDEIDAFERGRLLAKLHSDLLPLMSELGPRAGCGPYPNIDADLSRPEWSAGLARVMAVAPELAHRAQAAVATGRKLQDAIDGNLPRYLLHGDFAEWNLLVVGRGLSGILDFDLCHVGTRPWEFAIARAWRAPELVAGYAEAAEGLGISLTSDELAAVPAVYRCFRTHMVTDAVITIELTGRMELDYLETQVTKFETAP